MSTATLATGRSAAGLVSLPRRGARLAGRRWPAAGGESLVWVTIPFLPEPNRCRAHPGRLNLGPLSQERDERVVGPECRRAGGGGGRVAGAGGRGGAGGADRAGAVVAAPVDPVAGQTGGGRG